LKTISAAFFAAVFAAPAAAQIDFPKNTGAPALSYQPPVLQYQPPRLEYRAPAIRQPIVPEDCVRQNNGKTAKSRRCVSDTPKEPAG